MPVWHSGNTGRSGNRDLPSTGRPFVTFGVRRLEYYSPSVRALRPRAETTFMIRDTALSRSSKHVKYSVKILLDSSFTGGIC